MMDGVISVSQNYTPEFNKITVCDLATVKPERGAEYKYVEDLALALRTKTHIKRFIIARGRTLPPTFTVDIPK